MKRFSLDSTRLPIAQTILLLWLGMASLQAAEVPEYKLKAAYLYNFASFTTWPNYGEQFNICIHGGNPFRKYLSLIEERQVAGATVTIHQTQQVNELKSCQLVFISGSPQQIVEVTTWLDRQPVLTITDTPGALDLGVMINLVPMLRRVGFEINLSAARSSGLHLSSKLLRLAQRIIQ